MNKYIAFSNGKRWSQIEVEAPDSYSAQKKAHAEFQKSSRRKIKSYEITVVLAEKDGEQVVHNPAFL